MAIGGYVSYKFLFLVSWLCELLFGMGPLLGSSTQPNPDPNFAPLYANFESFFTGNVCSRLKDIFHQPISSVPGAQVGKFFSYYLLSELARTATKLTSKYEKYIHGP